MDPARFARVDALFHEALERPPEARAAFLEAACDDATVRAEVEALLQADAADGPFVLDAPLLPNPEREGLEARRRVGPYALVRELGRGGMGTVYLARRDDVDREVALKVVRGDLADPSARRRFLVERRVLARLSHPGIARLYDAGVADDGTPYFAMEYVEGEPLTDYADARGLGLEARLRLFEAVGRAVQYAHGQLVVHRDLKPSNVLVAAGGGARDAGGVPSRPQIKLLDFGIAKLLDEAEDEERTATGRRLLTPAYAAPEQRAGGPVTAATDVYALGVLLFELLTGRRPDDSGTHRPSTALATGDAAAARTRGTTADRLARRLRGDLDVICETALREDPARRYASVEALVEDVRRHREGLPVAARRDSVGYRARKFVRRHRRGVAAAAAGVLALVALTAFYTTRLAAERDRAQLEARTAERVSGFLVDLFGASDPFEEVRGDTLRAIDLLACGAARVEAELDDEPAIQATLFDAIADVYVRLGRLDEAEPLYERALGLRRRVLAPDDPDLAETLRGLAALDVERGRFATADSLGSAALSVLGPGARGLEAARVLYTLGLGRHRRGDFPAADSLHRRAAALFRALAGPDDDETVAALAQLAHVAEALGDDSTAAARAEAVLEARRRVYGDVHPHVAEALNDVAFIRRKQGRYDEAEGHYLEALAIKRRLLGRGHPSVASTLNNLGVLYGFAGRYDEVAGPLEEALAIRRARYGDVHPEVASTLGSLSMLAVTQRDYDLALRRQDEALAILRRLHTGDHPSVAATLITQGQVRYRQGRFRDAERIFREALAMERRLRGGDHEQVAKAANNVGAALVDQGRYAEARPVLDDALAMFRRLHGDGSPALAPPMRHLARVATAEGRYTDAERLLTDALRLQADGLSPDHPALGPTREALVALYETWGRPRLAARYRPAG